MAFNQGLPPPCRLDLPPMMPIPNLTFSPPPSPPPLLHTLDLFPPSQKNEDGAITVNKVFRYDTLWQIPIAMRPPQLSARERDDANAELDFRPQRPSSNDYGMGSLQGQERYRWTKLRTAGRFLSPSP